MINVRELKVQALQTAMKNPRLAKLVVSAAKSPLGSSIRTQTQHVIDSLYSTQLNHVQSTVMPTVMVQPPGGKGGAKNTPVPMLMQPPTPPDKIVLRPATLKPYGFQRPATPRPAWSLQMAHMPSKQDEDKDGKGGSLLGNFGYGMLGGLYDGIVKPAVSGIGDMIAKPFKLAKNVYDAVSNPSSLIGPAISGATNLYSTGQNVKNTLANPSTPTPQTSNTVSPGQSGFVGPVNPNSVYGPSLPGSITPPTPAAPSASADSSSFVGPIMPKGQPGTFSEDGTYTPSGDAGVDYLMKAYGQGIGANSFALGAMADSKKLQSLFPGVPASQLPVGASLAGQLSDLQDVLYKEYNIDNLYQTLNQSISNGQNLPEVATSYIRGKDEFLNSLDQMQKKATDAILNNPMGADPFVQKSMQQYSNYLSVLKGRTTQRYVDYLNTATNYQTNQINNLTQQYNAAADIVNRKYTQQAAITTETYNDIKQALVSMYDNVSQRATLQASNTKNEIETQTAYYNMIKAAADAQKASDPSNGKTYSENDFKTIDNLVGGYNDILSALGSSSLKNYDPGIVFERYGLNRATKIKDEIAKTGVIGSLWGQDKNNLTQISTNAENLGIPDIANQSQRYVDNMNSAYSTGILQYLKDHKDKVYALAKSMKNQASFDTWKTYNPWFHSKGYNVQNYLTGDNAVPEDLAQLIFNAVKSQQNAKGGIDEGSLPLEDLAGAILGQLN